MFYRTWLFWSYCILILAIRVRVPLGVVGWEGRDGTGWDEVFVFPARMRSNRCDNIMKEMRCDFLLPYGGLDYCIMILPRPFSNP